MKLKHTIAALALLGVTCAATSAYAGMESSPTPPTSHGGANNASQLLTGTATIQAPALNVNYTFAPASSLAANQPSAQYVGAFNITKLENGYYGVQLQDARAGETKYDNSDFAIRLVSNASITPAEEEMLGAHVTAGGNPAVVKLTKKAGSILVPGNNVFNVLLTAYRP
ncbi:hypothetical protein AB2475_17295 [Salmonella enterica]|uniref:hypothetical protein n=1 Tax=Salmonella enterica TaxID=28901 RepID=UPI0034638E97